MGTISRKNQALRILAILAVAFMLTACGGTSGLQPDKTPAPITQPSPPPPAPYVAHVWIQGDSISDGYFRDVRTLLGSGVVVEHNPDVDDPSLAIGNARDSATTLAHLHGWLDGKHFDVCHFNNGQWDISHRIPLLNDKWNLDNAGPITTTQPDYDSNMDAIVTYMQLHCTVPIFATTTPVPVGAPGRMAGDEDIYNAIAIGVMQRHGVRVDDLNSYIKPYFTQFQRDPTNVHYTHDGYQFLAYQVADSIEQGILDAQTKQGH